MVGATVQFLIKDPVASTGVVQDLNHSMRMLAQTTLVNTMMTLKLVEIQNDKKFIGIRIQVHTRLQCWANQEILLWKHYVSPQSFPVGSPGKHCCASIVCRLGSKNVCQQIQKHFGRGSNVSWFAKGFAIPVTMVAQWFVYF